MRLSTREPPDLEAGVAVIRAALARGVDLLDTADAYAPGPRTIGHNERMLAAALEGWSGAVRIVTKGGLTRPRGAWVPDGRRKHLLAAAEASCERLGRVPDLYLLHALDPRTKLETSVRALDAVRERGLARAVGLCHVRLGELRRAREITEIAAVQVGLSVLDDTPIRSGVVGACLDAGIEVLAHSPLGGPRRAGRLARLPVLAEAARRLGRSPYAVALAWLRSLGVVPIPGPTSVDHVEELLPSPGLDGELLDHLDAAFPAARILRTSPADRRPPAGAEGDVVLLMGSPASGKSTEVRELVAAGYHRLNRDLSGGSLAKVADALDAALSDGHRRIVLDNTYPARAQRSRVVEAAWAHGVPVRCVYKETGLEDARMNACLRMVRRHGRLLEPDEMKRLARTEPNSFPPRVLQQWPAKLEDPELEEGFASIERIAFRREPAGPNRAVIADAHALRPGDRPLLEAAAAEGWLLFAVGWSGGGPAPGSVSVDGLVLETHWCTHPPGPPVCWCRPPLPGLAATLVVRYELGETRSIEDLREDG